MAIGHEKMSFSGSFFHSDKSVRWRNTWKICSSITAEAGKTVLKIKSSFGALYRILDVSEGGGFGLHRAPICVNRWSSFPTVKGLGTKPSKLGFSYRCWILKFSFVDDKTNIEYFSLIAFWSWLNSSRNLNPSIPGISRSVSIIPRLPVFFPCTSFSVWRNWRANRGHEKIRICFLGIRSLTVFFVMASANGSSSIMSTSKFLYIGSDLILGVVSSTIASWNKGISSQN